MSETTGDSRYQRSGPAAGPGIAVVRRSAGFDGTLFNWRPRRLAESARTRSREMTVARALDLEANDPHVSGLIESISVNTVGAGFRAQAKIAGDQVPLTRAELALTQKRQEWEWRLFERSCDIAGRKHFADFCQLLDRCMLNRGEYLVVLRWREGSGRHALKLQLVDPLRLKTPSDLSGNGRVHDGVEVDGDGRAVAYWIHNDPRHPHRLCSASFKRIPARRGHRPQVLHGYVERQPDQYRGEVFFSPAMKFFRDLADVLDSEVVSNVITSALALFIETPHPDAAALAAMGGKAPVDGEPRYEGWDPGQVLYGSAGQKPHLLSGNRPGDNFLPFIETVLRAASSCAGIPYEVAAKKYGEMNYSSARAALLEAWRVFGQRQDWLIRHFCQTVWELVMEECYLRDYLELPQFYLHREAYTQSYWITPPKGHIDPVKEIQASILKLRNQMTTQTKLAAEQGLDWEADIAEERGRELEIDRQQGLSYPDKGEKKAHA